MKTKKEISEACEVSMVIVRNRLKSKGIEPIEHKMKDGKLMAFYDNSAIDIVKNWTGMKPGRKVKR